MARERVPQGVRRDAGWESGTIGESVDPLADGTNAHPAAAHREKERRLVARRGWRGHVGARRPSRRSKSRSRITEVLLECIACRRAQQTDPLLPAFAEDSDLTT